MMKTVQCTKCAKDFALEGPNATSDQVPRMVSCPYCKELNQVLWPQGAGLRIQTLPR